MRIAMWSGPRNLSTAMMYSFGARSDFAVWDEPYYGAYLAASGADHPMRKKIIAAQNIDPDRVATALLDTIPGGKPHFYFKHMTHHMLPGFDRSWLSDVSNVFLIRHPARVIASYVKKRESPKLTDLGFAMQAEILDQVTSLGRRAIVIDSQFIRANPGSAMRALCAALGLGFESAMLNWPPGGHAEDGVWAPHWYGAVHKSTGFAGAEGPLPVLSGKYEHLTEQALPIYEKMLALAIGNAE